MTHTPQPSPQADGTPDSLHKTPKAPGDRADDRSARQKPTEGDEHLGAKESQVRDTSPPAGQDYQDEPKQG
jgi:hypothetical protein